MIDPIDMIREVSPHAEPSPELLERVRNDLMNTIELSEHDETRQSQRGRGWIAPFAAVAVVASAAAGWAAVRGDSSTSTSLTCPGNHVVNAVTGDPVADCADVRRDINGAEPPPMTAYDDGEGRVVVLVDGEAVPDGYLALAAGVYQDPTLIELSASLDESLSGLTSSCFDEAGARDVVQGELTRLGLDDWSVTVDESRPPTGQASCAYFIVQPDQQQIQLFGNGPASSQPSPYEEFASQLDARLNDSCLALDAAADAARELAADTDVSTYTHFEFTEESGLLDLHTIEDPSATCTRANVNVGGVVAVTLRGPLD